MPLLQLPAELLILILNHVGPEFFAQDPRRLAVCKQWHDLAWPVLVRDLRLTTTALTRFTAHPALAARSERHITTTTLHFQNTPRHPAAKDPAFRRAIPPNRRWSAQLTTALITLSASLSRARALHTLTLTAHALDTAGWHLPAPALATLLSSVSSAAHHLTSLTIDTASCPLQQHPDTHLCAAVNALLPTLRHLRFRAETVCPALLAGDTPLPQLKTVLVNLSLAYLADDYLSYRHAKGCGGVYGRSIVRVRAAMEEAAVALVGAMGEDKGMVRIISHRVPALDVFAFDAVVERRVQLWSLEKGWDAEGDPEVEEEDVEEDLAEIYESDLDH